jgi:hypothetical protein
MSRRLATAKREMLEHTDARTSFLAQVCQLRSV